jgi:hypothetical protein
MVNHVAALHRDMHTYLEGAGMSLQRTAVLSAPLMQNICCKRSDVATPQSAALLRLQGAGWMV